MSSRPYVNKGIDQLEAIFASQNTNQQTLVALQNELGHRKTKRAQKLLKMVLQAQIKFSEQIIAQLEMNSLHESSRSNSNPSAKLAQSPSSFPEICASVTIKDTSIRQPNPPISNQPSDILNSWIATEVLSPTNFKFPRDLVSGDQRRIAEVKNGQLPWENGGEPSKPKKRLYYQVILGTVCMEPSISALLNVYNDSREERPLAKGESVLATIMVDRDGRPVQKNPIAVSSFGWAVPIALAGDLSALSGWSQDEWPLVRFLTEHLVKKDKNDEIVPLTWGSINSGYDALIDALGLNRKLSNRPSFVLRTYQYFRTPEPPEAIILNSFFLEDLQCAAVSFAHGSATGNLKRYLGAQQPTSRKNLMSNECALEFALEPKKFPLGAWPAKERHRLVTLQQCAVNLGLNDLSEEGILAVNGPPGTGKTTLLRDVIAAIVTDRAQTLVTYDDPEEAFTHTGEKIARGNAFIHLYSPDEKIRGREIVVASSNNKAVENVSAELPGLDAVATDSPGLRYFETISSNLLETETWGAIAAVLGNADNRNKFKQKFWWDEEVGLQTYLQHASGTPKFVKDKTGDKEVTRPPRIIEREKPPHGRKEALKRWQIARRQFGKKLAEVNRALSDLQVAFDLRQSMQKRLKAIRLLEEKITGQSQLLEQAGQSVLTARQKVQNQGNIANTIEVEKLESRQRKLGFIRRLFNWSNYKKWSQEHHEILLRLELAKAQLESLIKTRDQCELKQRTVEREAAEYQRSLTLEKDTLTKEQKRYQEVKERHNSSFVDDAFFEQEHHDLQTSAPWLNKKTAELRQDLFEAAMLVHKTFIEAAAKPIRHNLNALLDSFGIQSLGRPEKDALVPELWSTLFLVVPVVSTTFASVSRMFGSIGPDYLGWLLVDEAGQALPQAAVGALMRTRRAVVVGDPIQIEPVVILPDQLVEAISKQFGVDPVVYSATAASAQTLSDNATGYFGTFETGFGTREVGVPLLVHRRCADPMFGISNQIAYENLMVQAKKEKYSAIRNCLGPSKWIDVQGSGIDKWCEKEGEAVLDLLRQLKSSNCKPDLYIVTPFVIVQNNMRRMLQFSGLLDNWMNNPKRWIREHIGTVHTVQGREAEAVIFILGAPNAEQRGARSWAGRQPNLANVAVTRAKEAIYVIGNVSHWNTAGVFKTLSDQLLHKHSTQGTDEPKKHTFKTVRRDL